jgi:hypothetical protein
MMQHATKKSSPASHISTSVKDLHYLRGGFQVRESRNEEKRYKEERNVKTGQMQAGVAWEAEHTEPAP